MYDFGKCFSHTFNPEYKENSESYPDYDSNSDSDSYSDSDLDSDSDSDSYSDSFSDSFSELYSEEDTNSEDFDDN